MRNKGANFLNKVDIASALMARGYKKSQMIEAIDDIFKVIGDSLSQGESVNIPGFGIFEVRQHKAHMGTDPTTHIKRLIPAYKIPAFKPSKMLKLSVRANADIIDEDDDCDE